MELADNSFKEQIDGFLSSYSEDFKESLDRFSNSKNNDSTLESKLKSEWKKVITLKKKTSYKNDYNQTVYQRFFMGFVEFKDSTNCDRAFNTLLTCLGSDCSEVSWGNELEGIKTTPFIFIKTDKEIIFCKIYC